MNLAENFALTTSSNKTAASSKHYNVHFHFHFADCLTLHAVSFDQGVLTLHFIPMFQLSLKKMWQCMCA